MAAVIQGVKFKDGEAVKNDKPEDAVSNAIHQI